MASVRIKPAPTKVTRPRPRVGHATQNRGIQAWNVRQQVHTPRTPAGHRVDRLPGPPVAEVITISPAGLSSVAHGVPYSQQLTASGQSAPYVFSLDSGAMPGGVTLSASGLISGTPAAAGTFTFTVRVEDAEDRTNKKSYTWIIT